ncbi:GH85 family endohexosaminidase C-terminal domain-containing protein [Haloplasma contractile]|uniref:Fibronectin type III domain protein n=1 Tax=Haloplasma contractile SSD-17B TaxID=1033810 RepID=U2DQP7_9MOLU|nr:fibronectin type III domain-containing protein [Haloplasma contractile]ERJ10927.1 Fibronectin type III domain protein [Haloplasma contractile SSD-17B]
MFIFSPSLIYIEQLFIILTAIEGRKHIDLSWNSVNNATSYNIYQKTSTGTYQLIDTTSLTSLTVRHLKKSNETYYYTVTAVNQVFHRMKFL